MTDNCEWIEEAYNLEVGYAQYRNVLYVNGVRTNTRRREIYDATVFITEHYRTVKSLMDELIQFIDPKYFFRLSYDDDKLDIFHYEEYEYKGGIDG